MTDPSLDILGPAEVAGLLRVQPKTVSTWAARGILPPADLVLARVKIWKRSTIEAWAIQTGRMEIE